MKPELQLGKLFEGDYPVLALAPMQDVTDLPFWRLMAKYGGPDVYFTEYFRVHTDYRLDRKILRSITENPTGRPCIAQLIGNDVPSLVRFARELKNYPIAAIDLNLGCPAPVVYRKCAGGGLLREPDRVNRILGELRAAIPGWFTVKTRLGFDDATVFDELLPIFSRHSLDLLTVHGRTVADGYRTAVHYDRIRQAAEAMSCPVLANGNIFSVGKAEAVLEETGCAGVMIGRHAIRNPWLFNQIRQRFLGEPSFEPIGRDVLQYIRDLYEFVKPPDCSDRGYVTKLKKYMNYFGVGVDPEGRFLHSIRRVRSTDEFFHVCREFLDHDRPMPLEPFNLSLGDRDVVGGVMR